DRHEPAVVRDGLEEAAGGRAELTRIGADLRQPLQRKLDVERLALRRELVRLEPVPEAAVGVAVGEHRGDHAVRVAVLIEPGEQPPLEDASGAVEELASSLE